MSVAGVFYWTGLAVWCFAAIALALLVLGFLIDASDRGRGR